MILLWDVRMNVSAANTMERIMSICVLFFAMAGCLDSCDQSRCTSSPRLHAGSFFVDCRTHHCTDLILASCEPHAVCLERYI